MQHGTSHGVYPIHNTIHLEPGGRGAGGGARSAADKAAYRHATCLLDTWLNREYDHRDKLGVVDGEVFGWDIRDGEIKADALQRLWAEADRNEHRGDSRTYWDLYYGLPRELSVEDRLEICREIARVLRRWYGVAGDWAYHCPAPLEGQDPNPHGHMGFTTRQVDGSGRFGNLKERRLNKTRTLRIIRRLVAYVINQFLKRLNSLVRVTWRSLQAFYRELNGARAKSGLLPLEPLEPTRHLGEITTKRIRRGQGSRIAEENERARERNRVREEYNRRVLSLDAEILRERARKSEGIQQVNVVDTASLVAPEPAAPAPSATELPLLDGAANEATQLTPAKEVNRKDLDRQHIEQNEQRLVLRSQLGMDDHYRRQLEDTRDEIEKLAAKCFRTDDADRVVQMTRDPQDRQTLLQSLHEKAGEEPGVLIRISPSKSAQWMEMSTTLRQLAELVESINTMEKKLLSVPARTLVESQLQETTRDLARLREVIARVGEAPSKQQENVRDGVGEDRGGMSR